MDNDSKKPSLLLSIRFLLAVLLFFGYAIQYTQKINMSVAIVCMVNNTALLEKNKNLKYSDTNNNTNMLSENYTLSMLNNTFDESSDKCLFKAKSASKAIDGSFEWPKSIQGFILASYFYGYIITEIPGGYLSFKFGAKRVYLISMVIGSIFTLVIPFASKLHYGALIASRFIVGLAHGVMWPSIASLWSHWAPSTERSILIGFSNAGSQIGNVIALPLGSFLCVSVLGWPAIFYVFGCVGLLWCILFFFLTSNSPNDNKLISKEEKEYILESTKDAVAAHSKGESSAPWCSIMKSRACISLFISHSCSNWGTYLFLTNIPTYMKEILKFDLKSSGGLAAIPYIVFWFFIVLSGMIGDKLIQSNKISRNNVRRIFNSLAFFIPLLAVFGLSFVTCSIPYIGVALLTAGLAFTGCGYGAGFLVNINDIAGSYAGIVFGISNTFATIPGIIAPYLVGVLTKNQKQEEWRIVFWITSGVYLIGALSILIFGSADLQIWARKQNTKYNESGDQEELKALKN